MQVLQWACSLEYRDNGRFGRRVIRANRKSELFRKMEEFQREHAWLTLTEELPPRRIILTWKVKRVVR